MVIDLNTDSETLQEYLTTLNWLHSGETISRLSSPGEGNMNIVIRVHTNQRTFILKQSRSYVRKYPDVDAPIQRIDTEYQWYKAVDSDGAVPFLPNVIQYSKENNLLMIEDIGESKDLSLLYGQREISTEILAQLVSALSAIHESHIREEFPTNLPLRQLNHQHIFVLPFMEDNGFQLDDIQEGLQALSLPYKQDEALKSSISDLGQQYLSKGDTLLHGDYYPGSWIKTKDEVYVIDPEFSFVGFAEFDLGVMAAHLILISSDESYIPMICEMYDGNCNYNLVQQYAGIEIMRRLIGLAQLPLVRNLQEKSQLLQLAKDLILE
ncbi:MAG: 5-methylthioribose kinase [Saprospiraceae bacterium]|jgi:5-methylthioribose kinase